MFSLIYLTILLSIISNLLAEKKIESCRCLAHLDVEKGLLDVNRLRTENITDQIPESIPCNNRGEFMCKALCKQSFKVESNNFNLDIAPNTTKHINITLGQYLCDVLHRDVSNVLLGMTSELSCIDEKYVVTTSTLKIFCGESLTCLNGKFIKQPLYRPFRKSTSSKQEIDNDHF